MTNPCHTFWVAKLIFFEVLVDDWLWLFILIRAIQIDSSSQFLFLYLKIGPPYYSEFAVSYVTS